MATFFFPHIMKTAGSSFLSLARTNLGSGLYARPDWLLDEPLVEPTATITKLLGKCDPATIGALDDEQRQRTVLFQGHLPLAAAELLDPPIHTMVLLREPVARTVSHLVQEHASRAGSFPPMTLEERYEQPFFLVGDPADHQVKVLSMTLEETLRRRRAPDETLRELRRLAARLAVAETAEGQKAALEAIEHANAQPAALALRDELIADATVDGQMVLDRVIESMVDPALLEPIEIDQARLDTACAAIDDAEILGVTERFGEFVDAAAKALDWHVTDVRYVNKGIDATVPDALVRRIHDDNAYDLELYRYALEVMERRRRRTVLGPAAS